MAYEISWDDVLDTALDLQAELGLLTVSQQNLILDMVHRRVPENRFLEDTFDARRYYAAHFAALALTPAAGEGTNANQSIGSVSRGVTLAVNNPTPDKSILETQYGRSYWEFVKNNCENVYTD